MHLCTVWNLGDHTWHDSVSVVRTTFKVYGKRQILTLSQPKTPEPIVTKLEWHDHVVDPYHQKKFGPNPSRGFCSPCRWNIHLSCSKFTTLFWFFNSPTGESVRPIFTLTTSNDAVLRKEVLFIVKFHFSLIYLENSKKLQWRLWEKLKNSLNCHNFRCVQDRVVIFGSMI